MSKCAVAGWFGSHVFIFFFFLKQEKGLFTGEWGTSQQTGGRAWRYVDIYQLNKRKILRASVGEERTEDSLWGFLMLREMGRGVYPGSQFSQKLPQREAEGSCLPCFPPPQGSSSKISFCIFSSSDVLTLGQRYSNLDGSPGLHVGPCFRTRRIRLKVCVGG